jgi:hypothetical protein
MWESPLKKTQKKEKDDPIQQELKKFKKPKCLISKSSAKHIVCVKTIDSAGCFWLERWIEQLVRECSYPPQLKSDDFFSLLNRYFETKVVLDILNKVRKEYRQAFSLTEPPEDDLSWLSDVIKGDPMAMIDLDPDFL